MIPGRANETAGTRRPSRATAIVVILSLGLLAACSPSMGKVNGKPDQYYGKSIRLTGRISDILDRAEDGSPILFHLVSWNGHRMIVFTETPTSHDFGDIVRVQGPFEHDRTVGNKTYYDVLTTESVRRARFLARLWFL